MFIMRRHFLRLLRLRNLLTITILVVVLYIVKSLSDINHVNSGSAAKEALVKETDAGKDFVPKSYKVSNKKALAVKIKYN